MMRYKLLHKVFTTNRRSPKGDLSLTGFTLVELTLVLIILALGLTPLLLMLRQATYNNSSAHFFTIARSLAQERMEQIISDRKTKTEGFGYINNSNYPAETPVSGFSTYNRSVNIYYVNPDNLNTEVGGPTDYKRVSVTVSGPGGEGDIELVSLVTDY